MLFTPEIAVLAFEFMFFAPAAHISPNDYFCGHNRHSQFARSSDFSIYHPFVTFNLPLRWIPIYPIGSPSDNIVLPSVHDLNIVLPSVHSEYETVNWNSRTVNWNSRTVNWNFRRWTLTPDSVNNALIEFDGHAHLVLPETKMEYCDGSIFKTKKTFKKSRPRGRLFFWPAHGGRNHGFQFPMPLLSPNDLLWVVCAMKGTLVLTARSDPNWSFDSNIFLRRFHI